MVIGVDLGGSNIRAGLLDEGKITKRAQRPLQEKDSLLSTLEQLMGTIREVMVDGTRGIGIAVPSIVDVLTGTVYNVVNIPSWEKVELKKILEEEFHLPVQVNNDANCFALGEYAHGVAKGSRNMLAVTLGTGVGSGVIFNGALYNGSNGGAGEVGYLNYRDHDYEYYCASAFFEQTHNTTARAAAEAAGKGDQKAVKIWEEFGASMAALVKSIIYGYDPDAVVFGGSISKAWPLFERSMNDNLHKNFHFPGSMKKLKILKSENEDIILLGATSLISEQ